MQNPEQIAAYAAGFFDGEGCVSIAASRKSYTLRVDVSNTISAPLIFLQENFSGAISEVRPPAPRKLQFQWYLLSEKCVPFLVAVFPYLRVKKVEALIGILFQVTFNFNYKKSGVRLPEHILSMRRYLFQECKSEKERNE